MYRVRRFGLLLTIFIIGLLMGKYGPTVINMLLSTVFILTWLMAFDESSYKRIQKKHAKDGNL
ncbi:hypothetical protein [Vagococcus luciliae]|uniref:DUF2273 domain-containing protein n=1 Tax=Vagococcus luciliae TaxID=2920380 RepID=A0ABY5NWH3_9ENTE|nr:hypothetical protein [Vagococcus luciliae]UUV97995.1 hypothetical protein G314FT_00860 [Vagococcus luciliae]